MHTEKRIREILESHGKLNTNLSSESAVDMILNEIMEVVEPLIETNNDYEKSKGSIAKLIFDFYME